jgi:hypothetical protein
MEELYHAALEKSGEEREALLANSDPEVRRGVEALLAQGTSGEKVLDHPAWLNRAYQERSYLLTYLTVDERLDHLHSDPRFDELRRTVGLPALK